MTDTISRWQFDGVLATRSGELEAKTRGRRDDHSAAVCAYERAGKNVDCASPLTVDL